MISVIIEQADGSAKAVNIAKKCLMHIINKEDSVICAGNNW